MIGAVCALLSAHGQLAVCVTCQRPLPGLDAQLRMAPSPRLGWDPLKFPEGAADGAALLLVYPA